MRFSWSALGLFAALVVPALSQTISTADAKNHIGQNATVCGMVLGEQTAPSSKGQPTFINLDGRYPNQIFTILRTGRMSGDCLRMGHVSA